MARKKRQRRVERDSGQSRIARPPWRNLVNRLAPVEVLSADQVEAIHHSSLEVLAHIGIKVLHGQSRDLLARAGAQVDEGSQMVRMDPALVEEKIALAPSTFAVRARNHRKSIHIGASHLVFATVGGPSFVSDLDRGRRAGTLAELHDLIRITQALDIIHVNASCSFEPMDLPVESRHLDRYLAVCTLSDKVWSNSLLGAERARDGIEMARISNGLSEEDLLRQAVVIGNINSNSPRQFDASMCEGLSVMARARQPVVVTPFTLSGAVAPVTLAGALAQQNAEALFGISLAQIMSPGTPVIYGGFTSNVNMKTGSPAFGTPEYVQAAQATGQLTRRYNIPYRSSNTNTSNTVDAQAAYESQMSLWGAVMGHANVLFHSAGWLEGGLVCSLEKLIIDAEMLQMISAYLQPITVDEDTLAFETIREVEAGGHYFETAHTLERYKSAFYTPLVSDWNNYEAWTDSGSLDTAARANRIWKALLAEYQAPPIDSGVQQELETYVAKRKEALKGRSID